MNSIENVSYVASWPWSADSLENMWSEEELLFLLISHVRVHPTMLLWQSGVNAAIEKAPLKACGVLADPR